LIDVVQHTTAAKELIMIVVRNVFQLKFGKAREALANMKEGLAIQKRLIGDNVNFSTRLLTDATGPFYTLVLEVTLPSLAALEAQMPRIFGDPEFQANYRKTAEFVESGYREIFNVIE
jgi:hypothetical protein